MSDKKITIIVPCYNVEKYLERCVDSLLTQTFDNFEIILVDDFSTDNTKNIIKKYTKKYTNIRAIYNKKNMRQGYARNTAIQSVNTEYIAFVDSDDWIEPNFLEVMYETLVSNKADIAACDIYVRNDNPAADHRVVMFDKKPNKFGLINVGLAASSSNKLFKTEILRELKYPEDIINEDVSVVLAAMYRHETAYTDKTFYNYYQRPGSTQNGQITNKRFDIFKAVNILKEYVGEEIDKKTWDAVVWHQIIQLLLGVLPRAEGIMYRAKLIKEYHGLAKENEIDIAGNNHLREFMMSSGRSRLYLGSLVFLLKTHQYLTMSVLMGLFFYYLRRKHKLAVIKKILRAPKLLVKEPRVFFAKLKARIFRKYVIKKNITIDDLVPEAKRQSRLKSKYPVSVIIPNYNYERFLIQRLYSILYQTEKVGEVIILDDNSTDNSVKLARKIKKTIGKYVSIKLINNAENQGTFRQWEKGFDNSQYEYVWIAEADDYCNSRFLESTLKPLKNNDDVVISYTDTGFIHEDGLLIESVKRHIDYQESGHWNSDYVNTGLDEVKTYSFLNNTIANVSSVVFRKRKNIDYPELFSYSRDYKQAGDWVFYVNYMLHGDIAYIDKTYNYYRLHGSNVSSKTKAQDHLKEINKVYEMLDTRLNLTKKHRTAQEKRIEFLKKAWNI